MKMGFLLMLVTVISQVPEIMPSIQKAFSTYLLSDKMDGKM